LLDEIRAIATTGLHYAENPFDRERYDQLLDIASQEYAERTGADAPTLRARFLSEVGYQTAKVGADAAVFDASDRILMVHRVDNDKWGLVAGWIDPNEAPEVAVLRELQEEAGLVGQVDQLVGVFFRAARNDEHPHGIVSVVYECSILGGELRAQAHEVKELAWRDIDDVEPDEWHNHHELLARAARDAHWRRRAGL
jgi:ADP-ribose pyrophosphatase YjhB (NUDIX family)